SGPRRQELSEPLSGDREWVLRGIVEEDVEWLAICNRNGHEIRKGSAGDRELVHERYAIVFFYQGAGGFGETNQGCEFRSEACRAEEFLHDLTMRSIGLKPDQPLAIQRLRRK